LPSGTRAIVLAVDGERELARVEERLRRGGLAHRAIREPDPPWSGALMAIGLVPVQASAQVRRVLGRLELL
jgi:hypothetical protein